MPLPPMVAIVGRKHHGKTTLTVRLAVELRLRGFRVMTIKHGSHSFNLDPENTDTYRHFHEGLAEKVAMISPDKFALVERWNHELSPEAVAELHMMDADVILCEGFKRTALPRIEIFRAAAGGEPLYEAASAFASRYLAIVTDATEIPRAGGIPLIPLTDPTWLETVADIIERRVIDGEV